MTSPAPNASSETVTLWSSHSARRRRRESISAQISMQRRYSVGPPSGSRRIRRVLFSLDGRRVKRARPATPGPMIVPAKMARDSWLSMPRSRCSLCTCILSGLTFARRRGFHPLRVGEGCIARSALPPKLTRVRFRAISVPSSRSSSVMATVPPRSPRRDLPPARLSRSRYRLA